MTGRRSPKPNRASGVVLPISALPSAGGIGDLGPAAYRFVDWLKRSNQQYWQILPLSIPDSTGSPYASLSAAAGNWLQVNAELLQRQHLLPADWPARPTRARVSYPRVWVEKWRVIQASYQSYTEHATLAQQRNFAQFQRSQRAWLNDYTLFQALKDRYRQRPWWQWTPDDRHISRARRLRDPRFDHQRELHAFAQWLWHDQWQALHQYAHRQGVRIIGDLPFFVRTDSADVWANPELFLLSQRGQPILVAGVPPDVFSRVGQRWGNPLYRWSAHRRQGFQWWIDRIRLLHQRCDLIRIDHFRGLVHTWQIPAASPTAAGGRWVPSPGPALLWALRRRIPRLRLIAEDLGPEGAGAGWLRQQFNIPTLRVLQFGWNGLPHNPHQPQAITRQVVYTTSTHDSNTMTGWWRQEAKWYERLHLRERLGQITSIAWQSIALAMQTPAQLVVIPVQDILGLGQVARFNRPGRKRGNWSWRLRPGQLTPAHASKLSRRTTITNRASST